MKEWKEALLKDESATIVTEAHSGSRRKTVRLPFLHRLSQSPLIALLGRQCKRGRGEEIIPRRAIG